MGNFCLVGTFLLRGDVGRRRAPVEYFDFYRLGSSWIVDQTSVVRRGTDHFDAMCPTPSNTPRGFTIPKVSGGTAWEGDSRAYTVLILPWCFPAETASSPPCGRYISLKLCHSYRVVCIPELGHLIKSKFTNVAIAKWGNLMLLYRCTAFTKLCFPKFSFSYKSRNRQFSVLFNQVRDTLCNVSGIPS